MSMQSFVSRRHKSRRDPVSRTGFQCGQFMVREGAQRPVIKVYTCIYISGGVSCIALDFTVCMFCGIIRITVYHG